ncbi:SusD/RagB family nutrient-binding outer membrane lipoprotein [Flavobacterium sp.]|uniref:SusD/RagB family nutrient-binding outer membrane lipoprotein n=1 Tax=Flavobacterium sp. TaxID=239 RepID=UPI003D0D9FF5
MKKIKYLIASIIAISTVSCSDYFDINENPNELHTDQAKPDQYLAAAQVGSYRVQATTMNRLGLLFGNAAGGNVQSFASPFTDEFQFNITNSFYNTIFDNLYLNVYTFQKIIDYNDGTNKYDGYKAISKICKAYYMQYLVDLYGNIPYKDAFKGGVLSTPKYDDDQEVYQLLLQELDEARTIIGKIDNHTIEAESVTTDVMLGGDLAKWKLFANTVELKMLLRMSKNTGAVAAWRDQRIKNMALKGNTNFINEDLTINPGYINDADARVNPFVATFGYDSGAVVTGRNLYCLSGHLAKCLNPYSDINYADASEQEIILNKGVKYPDVLDPRRYRIFSTAASNAPYHKAVTQGSVTVDVYKPGGSSIGQPSKISAAMFNPYNETGNGTSLPNAGTGNFYAKVKGYVMTAAESKFLQAEAKLLSTNGIAAFADLNLPNAQTSFDDAVTATFPFYQSTMGTYLATINTKSNFGYSDTFSFQENYHAIMYQKWIATLNSNAIEAYINNTRTGFPLNPMPKGTTQTSRPKRLIYPISEYVANSANVPNVSQAEVYDVNSKHMPFWLQGDPALGK